MSSIGRLIIWAGPLLLLILTAIAGYAYSQILSINLPISKALGLFTIILPLITGVSVRLTQTIILRTPVESSSSRISVPLVFVLGFQFIYETVVITLALTNIVPPSSLNCGLEEQWQAMFSARNENAIRRIQDRFGCCGFLTTKNRAWPFPDKTHRATACEEAFGRTKACFRPWKQAQQTNAGLLLLVAILVFITKLGNLLWIVSGREFKSRRSWVRSIGYRDGEESGEGGGRREERRLIGERESVGGRWGERRLIDEGEISGGVEEGHRNDVDGGENLNGGRDVDRDGRVEPGPRVQPSAFGPGENMNIWAGNTTAGAA